MTPEISYVIDTFFAIFAFVLIIFMVPGFAMLEAGLVRTKNVTSVLMINTMIYALASMAFLLIGYSIAFGSIGSDSMSQWAAFLFQMAFVGKVINIMSGGVGERAKILPLALFTVIMGGILYPIVVNVSWGANMLAGTALDLNMYDLAGSTVIHSTGGWALLAAILIIGARKGRYGKNGQIRVIPAANIPLVTLGAFLLWIGWFGFNGGSVGSIASKENANLVALTILNTNTAGLAGAIMVGIMMYLKYKKLDITMILNGALGGLVSITAGPDLYNIYQPILIGAIGGLFVVFAVPLFDKLKLDDPVGALSVHLVNGVWGTLAVGIFVDSISFLDQLKGVVVVAIFAFVSSYIVLFIINKIMPLRASDDEQMEGLDVNECGLEAYPEFKRAF
ncbi:MAG: ammonium transporter [Campylobacteraceae bacterium]|jgi:Amt family ammonium transporter|nr:ammonium transporter [Campylobacteraceae bacterium]MBT3883053.1 ammonium transporter [Campylobacteraceae bacterium]MBT4030713.1 ammonium transporter [Campylobacteraceae bacterium]MBT4178598.1 ammonium transporter [Campylobacteraceae bacterium]MBT4572684.1 ammonium transporter [Campylobacteraceae bacterium]